MAQAKTLTFGKQLILLSDMASPGPATYKAPCGFEQLRMTVNVNTNDTNVPDCSDPDLPGWLVSSIVSQQMSLSGQGVLDTDAMQVWRDWFENGSVIDTRWKTEGTAQNGGGHYEAPGILSAYEESGQRGQLWQISATINLNGKPVWTAAT